MAHAAEQPEHNPPGWTEEPTRSLQELARRQGVRPVESLEDLARPGIFASDEEWQEFLADLYASRRAGLG